MKNIFIVALSFGLAFNASAQRGGGHAVIGGFRGSYTPVYRAPVIIGGYGYAPWYGYGLGLGLGFGYGFGLGMWNPYWGYPYAPYYNDRYLPSRLSLQIQDIKNDYKERIAATKENKSMTHRERRAAIRQLKHDRDQAIIDAKRNFYYNSRRNNGNNHSGNGYNGSGSNNSKNSNDDGTLSEYKQ